MHFWVKLKQKSQSHEKVHIQHALLSGVEWDVELYYTIPYHTLLSDALSAKGDGPQGPNFFVSPY